MFRWAQDRDLVGHDPAANVRLPAMDATPRERVRDATRVRAAARCTEAGGRAAVGPGRLRDCAQAGRSAPSTGTTSTSSFGAVELAADEEGRKPGGSWRVVPAVKPLHNMLSESWIAQGRPSEGKVCPPRQRSKSGMLQLGSVARRVREEWEAAGLEPIRLARVAAHRGDVPLDHAGVSRRSPRR